MQHLVTGSIHLSNSTMETFTQPENVKKNCFACHDTAANGPLGLPAMNLNISHILQNGLLDREEVVAAARHLTAMRALAPTNAPSLNSFNDMKNLLNTFVQQNNVPIGFAPHADFWNTLSYQQFTTGNIPNVTDPTTQMPMRLLIPGNANDSNLIKALRGTPGTVFDPNNGAIGRMPPSGPFMADQDIDRIADWINRNCPQ
jgi:mono/diheme cytochrome c family protein